MVAQVSEMNSQYGEKLNVHMVGFGNAVQDFPVLMSLVEAVESTNRGVKQTYYEKLASKMVSALSGLVSSTFETRTQIMDHGAGSWQDAH